jgi:hypothetical protein
MRSINSLKDLEATIQDLEYQQKQHKADMLDQLEMVKQSIRPSNLLKHAFNDLKEDRELRQSFFNSATSMGLGFLTKSLFVGKSGSIVKTLLGNIAESAIREISSGEKFQAYWQAIVKNLFRKKNKNEEATSTDEEDDFID